MEKSKKNKRIYYPTGKLLQSLFQENLHSIVALCHENERPLQGLASELDSFFNGYISHLLKKGFITGQSGECTLIPMKKGGFFFNIYLLGCGEKRPVSLGPQENPTKIKSLISNISQMNIQSLGLSEKDFHKNEVNKIESSIHEEAKLWIFQ